MESDLTVTQISAPAAPAIHAYYDLCPESPDGQWVSYFEFAGEVPGPGRIVIARPDGSGRRTVAEAAFGNAHAGALQQWVDAETIAFHAHGTDATVLASIRTGRTRTVPGAVRMVAPAGDVAITFRHRLHSHVPAGLPRTVWLTELAGGRIRELFTVADALAVHPRSREIDRPDCLGFMNTKWAPDGSRFFVVFNNERYRRSHPELPSIKSVLVAEADGTGLRFAKDISHHPMWAPDGSFVYSHDRPPQGGHHLIATPLEGSAPFPLVSDSPGVHAALSRDGSRVIMDAFNWPRPGRGAVIAYDLPGGAGGPPADRPQALAAVGAPDTTHETGCHIHPVWSRDQRRIYFNTNETGRPAVHAIDL